MTFVESFDEVSIKGIPRESPNFCPSSYLIWRWSSRSDLFPIIYLNTDGEQKRSILLIHFVKLVKLSRLVIS